MHTEVGWDPCFPVGSTMPFISMGLVWAFPIFISDDGLHNIF